MKKVTAVIINYNTPEMTERAVRALHAAEPILDFSVVLVDNGSELKPELADLKMYLSRYIACRKNHGFAGAAIKGIKAQRAKYVLLLNSDALVSEKAVTRMVRFMDLEPHVGVIGARMVYPDGATQASFGRFPKLGRELMRFSMLSKLLPGGTLIFANALTRKYFRKPVEVDWVSGGCMLIRTAMLEEVGSLDKNYFFGVEDIDLCYRAKQAGWRVAYYPQAAVTHYHGYSSGGRRSTASLRLEAQGMDRFFRKHYPGRWVTRFTVKFMYRVKAGMLDMVFKFKETGNVLRGMKQRKLKFINQ